MPLTNKNKDLYTSVKRDLTVFEWISILKSEYSAVFQTKIPVRIEFFKKQCKDGTYIINTELDAGYESKCYLTYMYKKIKKHSVLEYSRIIHPVKPYKKLLALLKNMDEKTFLLAFANIKGGI